MLENEKKKRHAKITDRRNAIPEFCKECTRPDRIRNEDIGREFGVFSVIGVIMWKGWKRRLPKHSLWNRPRGRRDPGGPRRR
jgi:hypothetical protein